MQKKKENKTWIAMLLSYFISFFTLSEFHSKIHWIRWFFPEIRGLPLVIVANKVLLWAVGLLQTPPKAIKNFLFTLVWFGIRFKSFLKIDGLDGLGSISGFWDSNLPSSFHLQISKCCSAVLCVIFFSMCALTTIFWNSFHQNEIICHWGVWIISCWSSAYGKLVVSIFSGPQKS